LRARDRFRIRVGWRPAEADQCHHAEVGEIVTHVGDPVARHLARGEQLLQRFLFRRSGLDHEFDPEFLGAPGRHFRRPAAEEANFQPALLRPSDRRAVPDRKCLRLTRLAQRDGAVGQHAVHIEQQ
jgi:hypothetical protein